MAHNPSIRDSTPATEAAAVRLERAARTGLPCKPVRDLIGVSDIDMAYAVQQRLIELRFASGARAVGRKIGLTSPVVQEQLGVDRPDFGVLLDDMDTTGLGEVPSERLLQPKAEAEVAFMLAADLDDPNLDLQKVRTAVDYAVAAIEIVDSRIENWDIGITDTIADNASSGLYRLGADRVSLDTFEPAEVTMRLYTDGNLTSEGTGAACLGDPLNALLWLAQTAYDYGQPLRAGQVILSGALGPMVSAPPGATIHAEISSLGTVTATFSKKDK